MVNNPPAHVGDAGSVPGSERSPAEENGNPLHHSCLGNPMDRMMEWVGHFLLQGIFLDQGSNPGLHKSFATEPDVCLVTQSYLTLCHPLDCSLPALLSAGFFRQKI